MYLHIVYPKLKTVITLDSHGGARSDDSRKFVLSVIAAALELKNTRDWTDYSVIVPKQQRTIHSFFSQTNARLIYIECALN